MSGSGTISFFKLVSHITVLEYVIWPLTFAAHGCVYADYLVIENEGSLLSGYYFSINLKP